MTDDDHEQDALADWKLLFHDDHREVRALAAAADLTDAATLERLRRHGVELARTAVQWAAATKKAQAKFPNREIVGDVTGVEQASSLAVARHKAARFAACGIAEVVDLCCGIGGDAIALAEVAQVIAVDRSPLRAWMCATNAGCEVRAADVGIEDLNALFPPAASVDPSGAGNPTDLHISARAGLRAFHLDPDRRPAHRQTASVGHLWDIEDYSPGPEFMTRLIATGAPGAIKLGPGVDLDAVPGGADHEIELIAEGRRLVQAVLWVGALARGKGVRTATILPSLGSSVAAVDVDPAVAAAGVSLSDVPGRIRVSPDGALQAFLFEPAAAIERASLLHAVAGVEGLLELCPGIGIATGDRLPDLRWFSAWRVLATRPWKERGLSAWVSSHGCTVDQVKTRGGAIDPSAVLGLLRKGRARGHEPGRRATLFGLRLGKKRIAVLGERVTAPPTAGEVSRPGDP